MQAPENINPNKQTLAEVSLILEMAIKQGGNDGRTYLQIDSKTGKLGVTGDVTQSTPLEKILPFIVKIIHQKDPVTRPELKRFANRFAQVVEYQLENNKFYSTLAKSISDLDPESKGVSSNNESFSKKNKNIKNSRSDIKDEKFARILNVPAEKHFSRLDALNKVAENEGEQSLTLEENNLLKHYKIYKNALTILNQLDFRINEYGVRKGLRAVFDEENASKRIPIDWSSRCIKNGEHHISRTYQQKESIDLDRKIKINDLALRGKSYLSEVVKNKSMSSKELIKAFEYDFKKNFLINDSHARNFILGIFDDTISELTHHVANGKIGPEEAALDLILVFGDKVGEKNKETLEFSRELFKDMVVFKGKIIPDSREIKKLPGSDSQEYKMLIQDFKSGEWIDIKNDEGEVTNPRQYSYENINPETMVHFTSALAVIQKEGSFIPAFQRYFEDVVDRTKIKSKAV